ncbi:TRAP transporter permease [Bacillus sp. Marseille-P3661]|uniref:TRAP transporter permease n=1 Tax=Bacillus sp. Marseille-P3661 TaxID=1936234 RepID=UPI000C81946B|nr:TRAP transporter permease [Bacillus sp. Marseille-P3661]
MNQWTIKLISALALIMAIFHLYAGGIQLFPATQQRAIHIGLAFALIFLLYPFSRKKKSGAEKPILMASNVVLAIISILSGVYIFTHFMELATSLNSPSTLTMLVGILVILMTLEASRRILGWSLPIISLIFIVYAFIGDKLPLMFAHSGFSLERIVTQVGLSNQGILGLPLGVSATYIVLFIIFGSLLEKSGAGKLFIDLAMALVGRFRGGAAKVSVVASALFGTISGSQVANVATTGVLTIPLMKKGGYKAEYAGAVEAVASTGGMFLPPVMGAVSFLIADFLQVDYAQVVIAAFLPALLYFIAIFIMVDLKAAQLNTQVQVTEEIETPNVKKLLAEKGHLLLPLLVLIFLLLVLQWSPPLAGFWSIVSIPIASLIKKETRMKVKDIIEALQQGVKLSLMVAAATACAGIVIGVINMTGMGLRFSGLLVELAGGSLFMLLVLTMLASIIMGMGLPPVASYIVLAILAAPAMTNLGVPAMAAHLFIFYYGTLSAITPPVAFAAYAASGISGADPMKTGFVAVRLAAVAFIVPFMFVYGPALIMQGSVTSIILSTISAIIGVYSLAVALEGYLKQRIKFYSRLLLLVGAFLLIHVGVVTDAIGVCIVGLILLFELKRKAVTNSPLNTENSIGTVNNIEN